MTPVLWHFSAPFVKKAFVEKHHYHGHINKHAESFPYECRICLKSFTLKTNCAQYEKSLQTVDPEKFKSLFLEIYIFSLSFPYNKHSNDLIMLLNVSIHAIGRQHFNVLIQEHVPVNILQWCQNICWVITKVDIQQERAIEVEK